MTRDTFESETYPEPVPWWRRPAEKLATMSLIVAVGAPVAVVTEEPLIGGFVGGLVAMGLNMLYWKLRGYRIREVYSLV